MIRRPMTLLATALLALSVLAAPATAHEDDDPLHGHMLIQRPTVEFLTADDFRVSSEGFYVTAIRRCVDLPVTPLRAHHANVHQGPGGDGLANAGHAIAPVAPFGELENCAALEDVLVDGVVPAGPPPATD